MQGGQMSPAFSQALTDYYAQRQQPFGQMQAPSPYGQPMAQMQNPYGQTFQQPQTMMARQQYSPTMQSIANPYGNMAQQTVPQQSYAVPQAVTAALTAQPTQPVAAAQGGAAEPATYADFLMQMARLNHSESPGANGGYQGAQGYSGSGTSNMNPSGGTGDGPEW